MFGRIPDFLIQITHVLTIGTVLLWLSHLLQQMICFGFIPCTKSIYALIYSCISDSHLLPGCLIKVREVSTVTVYAIQLIILPAQRYRPQTPPGLSGLMSYLSTSPHIICISVYHCGPNSTAPCSFHLLHLSQSSSSVVSPSHGYSSSITSLPLCPALSPHLLLPSVNWMSCHSCEDD